MQPNENTNQNNNLADNGANPAPTSPALDNDTMQPLQPPESSTSPFAPEQPAQNIDSNTNLNSSFNATIKTEPAGPATNQAPVIPAEQQPIGQTPNPNLTIVNNVPKAKKSPVVAIIIILLILLLAGGGAAAYFILSNNKKTTEQQSATNQTPTNTTQDTTSTIPDGFKLYENKDLGFKFNYPITWGEVSLSQRTRNSDTVEPVKSYFFTFSKKDKFKIIISPTNWKYTGAPTEIDGPLTEQSFKEATVDTGEKNIITKNSTDYLIIEHTAIDGDIALKGGLKTSLSKIPAEYIEFRWQAVDNKCGTASSTGEIKPQLTCYPQDDIDDTKAVIKSFTAL